MTHNRGGSRIQKGGGGFVHSEGGVSYRNFRSGSKLLQGPGQINKQKKIADSRRGGGFRSPKKNPCIRACIMKTTRKGTIATNIPVYPTFVHLDLLFLYTFHCRNKLLSREP